MPSIMAAHGGAPVLYGFCALSRTESFAMNATRLAIQEFDDLPEQVIDALHQCLLRFCPSRMTNSF